MPKLFITILILYLFTPQSASAQEKTKTEQIFQAIGIGFGIAAVGLVIYKRVAKKGSALTQLEQLRREALMEIFHHAAPAQREMIDGLRTEAEINTFLDEFWHERDPIPSPEGNELRQEIRARIAYANKRFAEHGEGWESERGRVYIIYGPPDLIERDESAPENAVKTLNTSGLPRSHRTSMASPGSFTKSVEYWVYFGHARSEQPNDFYNFYPNTMKFVFGDKDGTGEYVQIYSTERGEKVDPRVLLSR